MLHVAFVVAPTLAGLDEFFHVLIDWKPNLAPPIGARGRMNVAGVVEMAARLLVTLRPKWRAHVVAAWLRGFIVDRLLVGRFYAVALRDFGLSLAALALARLAIAFDDPSRTG